MSVRLHGIPDVSYPSLVILTVGFADVDEDEEIYLA